jgi:hypothetical protein
MKPVLSEEFHCAVKTGDGVVVARLPVPPTSVSQQLQEGDWMILLAASFGIERLQMGSKLVQPGDQLVVVSVFEGDFQAWLYTR